MGAFQQFELDLISWSFFFVIMAQWLFVFATLFALVQSQGSGIFWPYYCPANMNVTDLNVTFTGKIVLVTGSNGHMGHIATIEAARRGAAIVIASARTNAEAQ